MKEEGKKKKAVPLMEAHNQLKRKRSCRITSKPNSLVHSITFNGKRLRKWVHNGRRVGRPRMNWAEETIKEVWAYIKKDMAGLKYMASDDTNNTIMERIKEHAKTETKEVQPNNIP